MSIDEQIIVGLRRVGMTKTELALRIGISQSALYQRLNNPELFRLMELKKIARIIGQLEVKL